MLVLLVLEVVDGTLDRILGLLVVLVLPDCCGQVVREVVVDHLVHSVGEWFLCVKDTKLLRGQRRASVIDRGWLEDASVDLASLTEGGVDFGACDVKVVKKEGGDDGLAVSGVRDDEPVVVSDARGIKYPITARMLATQAHLRQLCGVSLRVDLQIFIVVLIDPLGGGGCVAFINWALGTCPMRSHSLVEEVESLMYIRGTSPVVGGVLLGGCK